MTTGNTTVCPFCFNNPCTCLHIDTGIPGIHNRPSWDEFFLNIAREVSRRSTCPRAQVGAVIVKDHHMVSSGYNGAPAGEPHCLEVGCLMENEHCQRAIHAETNAVAMAARFGIAINGATLYYWDSQGRPSESCVKCSQIMKAAGIIRIVGVQDVLR